jgi:hypothetical protein
MPLNSNEPEEKTWIKKTSEEEGRPEPPKQPDPPEERPERPYDSEPVEEGDPDAPIDKLPNKSPQEIYSLFP